MLVTEGYKHIVRISNTYYISMATMVAQTGLKVTLYMQGFSSMVLYRLYHLTNFDAKNQYYLLNYTREQSPSWEPNRLSASQEILCILWNPKVHYCIHTSLPPIPILSLLYPVRAPAFHFLQIHLNIIPSMPGSSKWSLSLRFPHLNPVYASPLSHMCYMPLPAHYSRFYCPNNIGWGVQFIKLLIM
jgi:hypothetical protein